MTDPKSTPSPAPARKQAVSGRVPAATPSRRRGRPAAASRILVTGLSVAATLGLATAMSTPQVIQVQPAAVEAPDSSIGVPDAVMVTPTNQPVVTTSHAS